MIIWYVRRWHWFTLSHSYLGWFSRQQYMTQPKVTNFVDGSHNCVSANSNFAMCCMSECTRFLDFNTLTWVVLVCGLFLMHWANRRDCGNSKEVFDLVGPYLFLGIIAFATCCCFCWWSQAHPIRALTQVCCGSTRKRWRPCYGKPSVKG